MTATCPDTKLFCSLPLGERSSSEIGGVDVGVRYDERDFLRSELGKRCGNDGLARASLPAENDELLHCGLHPVLSG